MRGSLEDCKSLVNKIDSYIGTHLNLVLSKEKTQITNASTELASFLSVNIDRKSHRTFTNNNGIIRRNVNNLRFTAPILKITKKLITKVSWKRIHRILSSNEWVKINKLSYCYTTQFTKVSAITIDSRIIIMNCPQRFIISLKTRVPDC